MPECKDAPVQSLHPEAALILRSVVIGCTPLGRQLGFITGVLNSSPKVSAPNLSAHGTPGQVVAQRHPFEVAQGRNPGIYPWELLGF